MEVSNYYNKMLLKYILWVLKFWTAYCAAQRLLYKKGQKVG